MSLAGAGAGEDDREGRAVLGGGPITAVTVGLLEEREKALLNSVRIRVVGPDEGAG